MLKKTKGYNKILKERSRDLRKNMTEQERKLWYLFLRNHTLTFYRQRVIDNYIVDFYCPKGKLVIELDGSQHYSEDGLGNDEIRTSKLEQYGLKVMRFTNEDINIRFKAVCQYIDFYLQKNTSFISNIV